MEWNQLRTYIRTNRYAVQNESFVFNFHFTYRNTNQVTNKLKNLIFMLHKWIIYMYQSACKSIRKFINLSQNTHMHADLHDLHAHLWFSYWWSSFTKMYVTRIYRNRYGTVLYIILVNIKKIDILTLFYMHLTKYRTMIVR